MSHEAPSRRVRSASARLARIARPARIAVVAGAVAVGLAVTASPAWAWHWTTITNTSVPGERCVPPSIPDPGGCAASVRHERDVAYEYAVGWAWFEPYSEWTRVANYTDGTMSMRLWAGGRSTSRIYIGDRQCLDWGRYRSGSGCTYRTGFNIAEGTWVRVETCVHTYHGEACSSIYGRA